MIKNIKITLFTVALVSLAIGNYVNAAMQSSNYVIWENVNHVFDGPVISGVSHSVSNQSATVIWNTSVAADSFVIYSTDSGFSSTKEQGSSVKSSTTHSVVLSGLAANTTYYYRVRSERVNGGATTNTPSSNSFITGADETTTETTVVGGGGGVLIIDKRDKAAPIITQVTIISADNSAAIIGWQTDEPATSFVEYGPTLDYGSTYGHWSTSTDHSVTITDLNSNTEYNFRALSSDDYGNYSYSENRTLITLIGDDDEETPEEPLLDEGEEDTTGVLDQFRDMIGRIFPEVVINNLTTEELLDLGSLEDLIQLINAPILSGTPDIEIGATQVTVRWSTDIDSNSLVALAPDNAYNPAASEPYQQIVGNFDEQIREHEVTIYYLTPNTTYHFQIRSKPDFGPTAVSRDYSFHTSIEDLQITSYYTQIIDNETAIFKWVTNKEADSAVQFAPYLNNVLAIDQIKTIKDNAISVIHEISVVEFVAGTVYDVELTSADDQGNVASKVIPLFSTTEDDLPPSVTHIKADSTIFIDRSNKIQTIISWMSNEPSTSRVYYQEGVHGGDAELVESTEINTNYTKEHVMVITKFKPGIVYSFRVESIDSGGNNTQSKVHTFMTAKKKESIIQIILNILENTFGWLTQIF